MKKMIAAVVLSLAVGAVGGVAATSTAQINVQTSAGVVTYYAPGNGKVAEYLGSGQLPLWEIPVAEFCEVTKRGVALCEAVR